MASTGECRENAAAPAMARALKSGVGCIWGRPRRLSGVSENSVIYPTPVSYTHLTLPTKQTACRSRWSPYH